MSEYVTLITPEIEELFDRAEAGDAAAQEEVATYYLTDGVFSQNSSLVASWLTKAAEQGLASAQKSLGLLYLHGEGVKRDRRKAVELLELAAKQDDPEALYVLGTVYEKGLGVPKDLEKADYCYFEASLGGHAQARLACLKIGKKLASA